ncbi:MAG: type I-A CRISPR-associated protein Cas7/Csa2 [Thermoproteaceae archaeon]|jgi:CRISPR-associated protein Csa2|nr:type I-A CRISPR-associated protein Cas7/Csa2 [Thermoproteaceae archaeon]
MTAVPRGFLSLSARVVVNAEAMNMVEAIGNVVRHRKATLVYRLGEKYEIRTVPVISGEALRHAIQAALAEIAGRMGLPVCEWCRRGEFVKHGVRLDEFFKDVKGAGSVDAFKKKADESIYEAERLVVESCVVEDVGGFLVPTGTPVKRTSVLEAGYMVPAVEGGRVMYGFDVQFHVRHAPGAQRIVDKQKQRREEQAQSVYNVESSSAIYAMSLNVELWRIGTYYAERDGRLELHALDDRDKRVRAALLALAAVLNGDVRVGGHWSSYRPLWQLESAVAVFSSPMPISAAPAVDEGYLGETVELARAKAGIYRSALGEGAVSYRVLVLKGPRKLDAEPGKDVEVVDSAPDFMKRLVELGLEYAGAK